MRMSCNGCRVLRKGCSEDCAIRPCLQWIKNPEAQANATVFLAKFYGRAGLVNLVNAGPQHLRPAIFRSLLYEACGRIVNPIYGSVGVLWSGSWKVCQAAVETVLKGGSITQMSPDTAVAAGIPGHKPYDIRHVAKNTDAGAGGLHRVPAKSRARFKRSRPTGPVAGEQCSQPLAPSEESNGESGCSAETAEGSHISQGEPSAKAGSESGEVGMRLDLSLRLDSSSAAVASGGGCVLAMRPDVDVGHVCRVELGLSLTS